MTNPAGWVTMNLEMKTQLKLRKLHLKLNLKANTQISKSLTEWRVKLAFAWGHWTVLPDLAHFLQPGPLYHRKVPKSKKQISKSQQKSTS